MNNIGNITQKYEHQTLLSETTDKRRVESQDLRQTDTGSDAARNDKVSLSQASKEMQLAKNAVAEVPEIREEKVAQIKQAIADNRYELNSEKIAEKLVGAHISEMI
jgi:negative regulator of flagellin synthesis FlgM